MHVGNSMQMRISTMIAAAMFLAIATAAQVQAAGTHPVTADTHRAPHRYRLALARRCARYLVGLQWCAWRREPTPTRAPAVVSHVVS